MTDLTKLPLVALLGLGLAACGQDSAVENRAEAMEERADELEDRADDIEPMDERDTMAMDDRDRMDMDDDRMTTGTTMGGMDPMMQEGTTVRLSGFQPTGTIYVALQEEGIFGSPEATYGTSVEPMGSSVDAVITGVQPGEYALAVFQDTNGNGQLDLGAGGVPNEPWYLGNGAGKNGAPSFADASKRYDGMSDMEDVDLSM